MASIDDQSDALPSPVSVSPVSGTLANAGRTPPLSELDLLRAELDAARDENARLVEALSAERRSSLRLQRELEEAISQLQDELRRARTEGSHETAEDTAPRHSWIARRDPGQPTADTVRPPPITAKR